MITVVLCNGTIPTFPLKPILLNTPKLYPIQIENFIKSLYKHLFLAGDALTGQQSFAQCNFRSHLNYRLVLNAHRNFAKQNQHLNALHVFMFFCFFKH